MRKAILSADSYSFADYFKLPYPTKDIIAELGYGFKLDTLQLPKKSIPNLNLDKLKAILYKKLPHISINSEMAKMDKGFTQLAIELMALHEYLAEQPAKLLFDLLHRTDKLIVKNIEAFTVPTDLDVLFSVLLGILDKED